MATPKVDERWKDGSYYGTSFSVCTHAYESGRVTVHAVEIEGLPRYKCPIEETFNTVAEAEEAGFRFACSQIDN